MSVFTVVMENLKCKREIISTYGTKVEAEKAAENYKKEYEYSDALDIYVEERTIEELVKAKYFW